MQLRQANERCRKLEEINQKLQQQNKYLLEELRMAKENSIIKATNGENHSKQAEPVNDVTQQSQSNDEDASNLNEDDDDDDDDGGGDGGRDGMYSLRRCLI